MSGFKIYDESSVAPPPPERLSQSNQSLPHRTPPSAGKKQPDSPFSISIKGASQRSISTQGSSQGSIAPSSSQGSIAAPAKPKPPPLLNPSVAGLPSKPANAIKIAFPKTSGPKEVLQTANGMSVLGASSLIRPAEVSSALKAATEAQEEGELVEEPTRAPSQAGNDGKEEPGEVKDDEKVERRQGRVEVKGEGLPTAPSSALTDLFPSSQPPSTPKVGSNPMSVTQSSGTDTGKRKERRRSKWEDNDPPRKREERMDPSQWTEDSTESTSHRSPDGKDAIKAKESTPVKESIQFKGSTQVKWDETVERAEASRTSGETREDTRHRSHSRGPARKAVSVRSHSRSSSRHSPPLYAGSQRNNHSEFAAVSGTDIWRPKDTWKASEEGSFPRSRSEHEPSNRHHREDPSHRNDRRGLPYDYGQPSRQGLDYGAHEEAGEPAHREHRSRHDRYNSHHHGRSHGHSYRDDHEQEGGRSYANLNQTGAFSDNEDRLRPPPLLAETYDGRVRGSQDQRLRRRSPSYGEYGQRPPHQGGQRNPVSQAPNAASRHINTGWEGASPNHNEHRRKVEDEIPVWERPHASQRGYDREPGPRGDRNSRSQHGWASHDRGRHAYGNNYRNGDSYPQEKPRAQAEEYRHLSPKREPGDMPIKEEVNPLKRSGSPLAPMEERVEGEPVTKRQRLESEEPREAQRTADSTESTWGAVPSLPADVSAPLPEEYIPPAPPSPPPRMADAISSSNGASAALAAGSPMQIETPESPPVNRTPILPVNEAMPAEAQPAAALAPSQVSITVIPANNVGTDVAAAEKQTMTAISPQELAPLIPPAWSPVLQPSPVVPPSQTGTVWRQNSPMMQSPVIPAGTTQAEVPSRAATPNPNFAFSLLDLRTPVANGDVMASDRSTFMRRKGDKLDPADDLKAYNKKFVGIARLEDFIMPTGADKKEATLGKGTFGVVTKAVKKQGNQVVALKLLQPPEEAKGQGKPGVLGTTVREIKILKLLNHENIVPLLDIVVDRDQTSELKTFLVFPYMDHDLCGLLKNPHLNITDSLIKLYLLQLLEGVAYMHHNNIVHRDLKSANILLNNEGLLQIADFGLARAVPQDMLYGCHDDIFMTNMVVTRWYRAPELFMGETQYGFEVDMWSVGCIMSEMWTRRVLFQGRSDPDQLKVIFDSCGTPDPSYLRYDTILQHKEVINDNQGADSRKVIPVTEIATPPRKRVLRDDSRYHHAIKEFKDLLDKFLQLDPSKRITAAQALEDRYIWMAPGPLPRNEVKHLAASKERRDQQEEAEAKERTKEVERIQHAHAVNIQAQMATSAAMNHMAPHVHMQHPPVQVPPHQYVAQATNPYAQPANFYPNQAPMMNPPMPPNNMAYNSNLAPPPGVPMNPFAPPPNVPTFPAVPAGRPPHDAMGMPPQQQQRPANDFGGNRQHGMPSNGGLQPRQPGQPFKPKFRGNYTGPQAPPPVASQEQPKNPRPLIPDRFG